MIILQIQRYSFCILSWVTVTFPPSLWDFLVCFYLDDTISRTRWWGQQEYVPAHFSSLEGQRQALATWPHMCRNLSWPLSGFWGLLASQGLLLCHPAAPVSAFIVTTCPCVSSKTSSPEGLEAPPTSINCLHLQHDFQQCEVIKTSK